MRVRNVHYSLEHGFVHNWLVAGPQSIALEPSQYTGDASKQEIIQRYRQDFDWEISETAVERGPLTTGQFQVGDYTGSWNYVACREDHFVEQSGFHRAPHYLRSWAYTQLNSKAAQNVRLEFTTHGPADIWLNGECICRQDQFCEQELQSFTCRASLKQGVNKILVCFQMIARQGFSYAMALRVGPDADEVETKRFKLRSNLEVTIPTLIEDIGRRNQFEQAAAATYVSQDVFEKADTIQLHWPEDLKHDSPTVVRLMSPAGQIYAEGTVDGTAGDHLVLQRPDQIPSGPYRIFIMPRTWEYYDQNLRVTREINLWSLGRNTYSMFPYGSYATRCTEALRFASQSSGLFAEIAKMALQQWTAIESESLQQVCKNPDPVELVGLLGLLYRFSEHEQFPKDLLQPLEDCILNYSYDDKPGLQIAEAGTESELLLNYAAEILAGQRFPERIFSSSGQTGQWHRQHGEGLVLAWLQERGAHGFSDWDSSSSFAHILIALSHLVDLVETDSVWELAAVLMDKLFVTLAVNSYRGVLGSTQGRASASHLKGGLLEPTAGIARLMWGMGIFNHHIAGPVSLACSEKYEFPSIISDVALSIPDEMWGREQHAVDSTRTVNKVTYKTPDSMLCSAQDYRPGQRGTHEHIWQATLGPAATVFVTHPACNSEDDARTPNYWAGNAVLPRVAQWKDALIAIYQLPENDWMGFTHAYFPGYAFDESISSQGWAFARKGQGYVALTASQGIEFLKDGNYATRELRSYGQKNIWLCHLGREAQDGDFSSFQRNVLALDVKYTDSSVHFPTLRGETLAFDWQGPFLRNDREEPLSGYAHYENPFVVSEYPSHQLEILHGENGLRLTFGGADK